MGKDYYNNILAKFIEKGGKLPQIPAFIPEKDAEAIRLLVMESYLDGYKTAKMKFKQKYDA